MTQQPESSRPLVVIQASRDCPVCHGQGHVLSPTVRWHSEAPAEWNVCGCVFRNAPPSFYDGGMTGAPALVSKRHAFIWEPWSNVAAADWISAPWYWQLAGFPPGIEAGVAFEPNPQG